MTVEIGDAVYSGVGRLLQEGTAEDRLARDLVYAKYQARYGGDLTGWRESALPIAIELVQNEN